MILTDRAGNISFAETPPLSPIAQTQLKKRKNGCVLVVIAFSFNKVFFNIEQLIQAKPLKRAAFERMLCTL